MEEAPLKKNYICMSGILSRTAQVDCITARNILCWNEGSPRELRKRGKKSKE